MDKPVTLPWEETAPKGKMFRCPDCWVRETSGAVAAYHSIRLKHRAPELVPRATPSQERHYEIAVEVGEALLQENRALKKYITVLESRLINRTAWRTRKTPPRKKK
jgi:hypothetical protein